MSSTTFKFLLLALGCALTMSCRERDTNEVSVAATTEASSEGSVKARKATATEKARLEEDNQKIKAIDERFPGSPTPWGSASERVTDISVPGVLKLAGGRSVQLDGIRCNEEAVGYLRRILQDDTVTVVVVPSGGSTTQPIPAEVWSADTDLQSMGLATSPVYSNIIQTAITSAWCQVEVTPTSKHNERYAALAQAFQRASSAR